LCSLLKIEHCDSFSWRVSFLIRQCAHSILVKGAVVEMSKKWFVATSIFILLFCSILSACGKEGNSDSNMNERSRQDGESKEPITLNIINSHAGAKYAQQYKDNDPYIQKLNELSGYNLNWEFLGHAADFKQQLTVRFASGELADLVRTTDIHAPMHPGAVENNIFTELTALIDQYGPNLRKRIPEEAWNSPKVSRNGKVYGIPSIHPLPASDVMYIRKDWLDKLDMSAPRTLDDWLAYFEAVKISDVNGNGDPNDEYGFYVRENFYLSDVFFKEFGYHPEEWTFRDGKLQPGIIQPEMKEAIKFWKMLYDNKYINPNLFTNKAASWNAGIVNGKAGSWKNGFSAITSDYAKNKFVNQPNVKLEMLNGPVGANGAQGLSLRKDQIYFVWVIPTSSEKAVEAIKFLDWAWSDPKAEKFFAFGVEGLSYTETEETGKVKWDKFDAANQANGNLAWVFYQLSINPTGVGTASQKLFDFQPQKEVFYEGLKIATDEIIDHDSLFMPEMDAINDHPELNPGLRAGTLFLDMFANVLTGKEELDQSFDLFVLEWKRRGGDDAIKEATEWYKKFHELQ
jgi:putative aldouronate transport system substrate-binding protein